MVPGKDQIKRELLDSGNVPQSNGDASEAVFLAESELIEEYLEGSMAQEDKSLFESNFLITDERREMYQEIRLLKQYSSGPHRFDLDEGSQDETERRRISPIVAAGGVVVLAVIVLLLIWLFFLR